MKLNRVILFFLAIVLLAYCKRKDKNVYDKYSNTLVKTTTNDTITIIGKWRMLSYGDGQDIYYFNQGASINFGYNHILQINNSEICTWYLNENLLKLNYSENTVSRTINQDSLFVYAEKINNNYQVTLRSINGKKTYMLSKE